MEFTVETIKPDVGAVVHTDRATLLAPGTAQRCLALLNAHGALVFPKLGLSDDEQLAFTDSLGERVNFTKNVFGGDKDTKDVYTIELESKSNKEPEYIYGSWFWHMDGACMNIPMPRITMLSCRRPPPAGSGQTEFANTFAAYDALPEDEKKALEGLRVMHSVVAGVREIKESSELDAVRRGFRR
jgi:alpha-ketoglutarate-dependent taurine dioxygenase